jgi:hypothetical protein
MSSQRFGRYEIKSEIGRGGMATVILAYDPRFERDVAIKVLPREFLHDSQFRARFEREAKMVALLEHPAIVPVYDFGDEDGQPYIVMRFMAGGSLSDRLHQGAMPLHEVIQIFNRLAPALDVAHNKGIIHRDLKPGNILFDQYGNACLSDFGIARLAQTGGATLTGGNILGTPAYMSPEQVQGDKEIDGRSDIYAMGVILYQLLSGNAPYQATTPARVMMMHILEPVPNILEARPNLPGGVEAVIAKAMAKDPDDRFQTNNEMALALAATVTEPITPRPGQNIYSDATMVTPGKTEMAPTGKMPTGKQPQKTVVAPRIEAQPAGRKRSLLPLVLIGLVVVALLAGAGGAGLWFVNSSANARATEQAAALVNLTAAFTDTVEAVSPPTDTPTIAVQPTDTLAAVLATDTPAAASTDTPEPTATDTPLPQAVTIGGSDKIAFVSGQDVWVANVDGTELERLTNDGAEKSRLQWLPDGSGLVYIQGKCAKSVLLSGRIDIITCFDTAAFFDDFAVSPDGAHVAISLDHEFLYIVPFDLEQLNNVRFRRDLVPLGECSFYAPYGPQQFKDLHWSKDSTSIAMVIGAPVGGVVKDIIEVRNFSTCSEIPARVGVQFPANYFTMKGYNTQPHILNFGWDGQALFALTGIQRNEGFGDLYIYNSDNNRASLEVNPIGGTCCYRDPSWSPDGRYLVFAYQEVSSVNKIQIYITPFGSIGTGETFQPLALPDDLFPNRDESPQPVLRPAQAP